MKKLFLLAWPIALAAVSCSNEEVVSVNNDANEIKFTAVANNATRAFTDSVYCNNWKPGSFNVWALAKDKNASATKVDGKSYFQEVLYSANKGKTMWSAKQDNIRFWPNQNAEKLDFYVMHNYNGTVNWDPTNTDESVARLAVTGFTVKSKVAEQIDFIYAVATNQTKPGTDTDPNKGDIELNFRHALSQIVFNAKNTNPNLAVKITKVEIINVANSGNCSLPTTSTAKNYEDHNGANLDNAEGAQNNRPTPTCSWVVSNATTADYSVDTEECFLVGTKNGGIGNLTNGSEAWPTTDSQGRKPGEAEYVPTTRRNLDKAMLLIPQTTNPASISTDNKPSSIRGTETTGTGAMIAVTCQMWNLNTANTYVPNDDVLLYSGIAYIPLDATWDPGKKYIYTLVFGKANGGYDETGKDILVPISFTVKVDDFTTVVEGNVNFNK